MLELVFIACLKTEPAICREERLAYTIAVDPTICTINAQSYLAEWAVRHPAYTVGDWRCEAIDGRAEDA